MLSRSLFFFFNDTATTEIYPLSLHDALPISQLVTRVRRERLQGAMRTIHPLEHAVDAVGQLGDFRLARGTGDRKSTRLNSSHSQISYAVFCLKKKNKHHQQLQQATYACQPTL